jgi:hypothetical protein
MPALSLVLGCATVRYAPDVPRIERGAQASGVIRALTLGEGIGPPRAPLTVELDVELPKSHGVAGAFLRSSYADGCIGEDTGALTVIAEPPGAPGDRYRQRLRVVVSEVGYSLMGPTTIDILVTPIAQGGGANECLRLPLTTGAERYGMHHESGGEWVLSTAARLEVIIGPTSMSAAGVYPIGIGRIVGPLRFTVAAGLAEAYCSEALCGKSEPDEEFSGPMLPLELEAEAFFMTTPSQTLALALRPAIGVAYLDDALGEKRRIVLRPGAAFKWLVSFRTAAYAGLPSTPRGTTLGFELPFGVFHDPADGFETGWFIGLGLTAAAVK